MFCASRQASAVVEQMVASWRRQRPRNGLQRVTQYWKASGDKELLVDVVEGILLIVVKVIVVKVILLVEIFIIFVGRFT